jgi:hypothetical protein
MGESSALLVSVSGKQQVKAVTGAEVAPVGIDLGGFAVMAGPGLRLLR